MRNADMFAEWYECGNGHRGTCRFSGDPRVCDEFSGACKS